VRELWARILAAQAQKDTSTVSKASIALLSLLDDGLAKQFEKFVAWAITIGCFPGGGISEASLDEKAIDLLKEIGLIDSNLRQELEFFGNIRIKIINRLNIRVPFNVIVLTSRGLEIAQAVFGTPQSMEKMLGNRPSASQQALFFKAAISDLFSKGRKSSIALTIGEPKPGEGPLTLRISGVRPEGVDPAGTKSISLEKLEGPLSPALKEVVTNIDKWFLVSTS
jgi:hypothetical protein